MSLLIIGLISSFFLGAALASFVHCWAHRLYSGEGFRRRSYCPSCRHQLSWLNNLPIFSYLRLKGRCAYCCQPIAKDYLISELAGGLLLASATAVAWLNLGGETNFWLATETGYFWLILVQALIGFILLMLVFWSDYWWMSIFVSPLLIGAVIVSGLNLLAGQTWQSLIGGILFGGLFFAAQFWLSKGRWLGEGDIYLGLFLGSWLGWPLIIPAIFIAYLVGAIVGLGLLVVGLKKRQSQLPLGVFLAPSGWLIFLFGQSWWQAYLHWLGW